MSKKCLSVNGVEWSILKAVTFTGNLTSGEKNNILFVMTAKNISRK